MLNHLEHNDCLVTKRGLYLTLKDYCLMNKEVDLLSIIPRSYYLPSSFASCSAVQEADMKEFLEFNAAAAVCNEVDQDNTMFQCTEVVNANEFDGVHTTDKDSGGEVSIESHPHVKVNEMLPQELINEGILCVQSRQQSPRIESCIFESENVVINEISSSVATIESCNEIGIESVSDDTIQDFSREMDVKMVSTGINTEKELVWILKPASRTNRGFGIKVVRGVKGVLEVINRPVSVKNERRLSKSKKDKPETEGGGVISQTEKLTKQASQISTKEGWIVQLYIERPMLVSGRKFDIRLYVLLTKFRKESSLSGYLFREAYVRTSSKKYSLKQLSDREAHLTNDAVQKNSKAYGKFEDGNKLSFEQWQESILKDFPNAPKNIVTDKLWPEMRRISSISIAAAAPKLNQTCINNSFELLGYDYMMDDTFQPYLIEINSNPCLEFVCPLLSGIISSLIENVVRVTLDTQLPPPHKGMRTNSCDDAINAIEQDECKFDLIYPTR